MKTMRHYNRLFPYMLILLIAACGPVVPDRSPFHLEYTSGSPAVVTDDLYQTVAFRARYPEGWRVITSAAEDPVSGIFVNPAGTSLIMLSVAFDDYVPLRHLPQGQMRVMFETVSLPDGATIHAIGVAAIEEWESFSATFERVLASVRSPGQIARR